MATNERRSPGFSLLILTLALGGCSFFRPTLHCYPAAELSPAPPTLPVITSAASEDAPAEMTFSELVDKALINTGCCEKPPAPDLPPAERKLHFDFGSIALSADARILLLQHAAYLKRNPGSRVREEGHADDQGTPSYHVEIGERRARLVADFLLAHGARPGQVTTVSFGDVRPLEWEGKAESRALNRRVEIVYRDS